jgi:hypothetical protein
LSEYQQKLAAAGFESIDIEPTRIYSIDDAKEFLTAAGIDADAVARQSATNSSVPSCARKSPPPKHAAAPLAAQIN